MIKSSVKVFVCVERWPRRLVACSLEHAVCHVRFMYRHEAVLNGRIVYPIAIAMCSAAAAECCSPSTKLQSCRCSLVTRCMHYCDRLPIDPAVATVRTLLMQPADLQCADEVYRFRRGLRFDIIQTDRGSDCCNVDCTPCGGRHVDVLR